MNSNINIQTNFTTYKRICSYSRSSRPEASACNFIKKETLAQVIFCEFCEISENTFAYRTPPVAASDIGNQMLTYEPIL